MAKLSLRAVSKTFKNGVVALAPVDLEVADGQFVVLLGPSGCGKSTLLRIIAGLEDASGGAVAIDGRVVNDIPAKSRDVAMVFQSYALYPHLTVAENLEFSLKMRGMALGVRRREVLATAELLQLRELLERRPGELSGGQQQRVALGRAIVRRPKLFLLDEPFSNLDATLRATTRAELMRLHRRIRTTTIFVTHDQVEAMSMADVLVVMKDGRVQQIGAPLDVYRQPANMFVAKFIGSPPMNLIQLPVEHGHVVMGGRRISTPSAKAGAMTHDITLGLRAEHFRLDSAKNKDEQTFTAKVILLEPLGNETLADCLLDGHDIVLRLPAASTVRVGDEITLAVDFEQAMWFDPQSGLSLEAREPVVT